MSGVIQFLSQAWRLCVRAVGRCVEAVAFCAMIGACLSLVIVTAHQVLQWKQTGVWQTAPLAGLLSPMGLDLGAAVKVQTLVEPILKQPAAVVSLIAAALLFWFIEELRLSRSRSPQFQPLSRAQIHRGQAHRAQAHPAQTPGPAVAFRRSSAAVRAALILASCVVFAVSIAMTGKVTATSDEPCCAPSNPITNSGAAPRVG